MAGESNEIHWAKYTCRKFLFGAFFTIASYIALMFDKLNGDQFVWIAGICMGLYSGADVMHKHNIRKVDKLAIERKPNDTHTS